MQKLYQGLEDVLNEVSLLCELTGDCYSQLNKIEKELQIIISGSLKKMSVEKYKNLTFKVNNLNLDFLKIPEVSEKIEETMLCLKQKELNEYVNKLNIDSLLIIV